MVHVSKTYLTIVRNGAGGQMENGWTKILKDAEKYAKGAKTVIT
jgi:hypothetical protein